MLWISSTKSPRGFSLIEILVAFVILSLAIGILLRIFAGGGQIAKTANDYYRAIITAESLLEPLGIESPVQPGINTGVTEDGYRWTINVTPYPMDPQLTGGMTGTSGNLNFTPYWVSLDVEWGPEEDPRGFGLETLRIAPAAQQGFAR